MRFIGLELECRCGGVFWPVKPIEYWYTTKKEEEEVEKCIVINLMNDLSAGNLFECRVDNFQFTSKRKIYQFIYRCDKIEEKTNPAQQHDPLSLFLSFHVFFYILDLVVHKFVKCV